MGNNPKTLTSWSYSVYCKYIECPRRVFFEKIQRVRVVEPENPHLTRGNDAHSTLEQYVGTAKGRPPVLEKTFGRSIQKFKPMLDQLRKAKARTEQEWAFDVNWNPVEWRDWERAWLRIKVDACRESLDTKPEALVQIVDYKTGKVYDDHKQQRSLYALGGLQLAKLGLLAKGAKALLLTAEHWYLDTGQTATEQYHTKDLDPLKKQWLARTKQMMTDTKFKAKPDAKRHCRWCPYAKSKGGPCEEDV